MSWMIYGAYGYTGRLVAALAAERGELPVMAGRDERRLRTLGEVFELEYRTVELSDPAALRSALEGVDVVAHCAGPVLLDVGADGRCVSRHRHPLPRHHR